MIFTSLKSSQSRCCCLVIGLHSRKRGPANLTLVLQQGKIILRYVQQQQATLFQPKATRGGKPAALRPISTDRSSHDQGSGSVLFVLGAHRADGLRRCRRGPRDRRRGRGEARAGARSGRGG